MPGVQCKDVLAFPMRLDLTHLVHPPADAQHPPEEQLFVLTAILLHRGSSASAGHYVCIVKDEQTGRWWKYDDTCVTDMGLHPFKGAKWDSGSGFDPATLEPAAGKEGKGKGGGRGRKRAAPPADKDGATDGAAPAGKKATAATAGGRGKRGTGGTTGMAPAAKKAKDASQAEAAPPRQMPRRRAAQAEAAATAAQVEAQAAAAQAPAAQVAGSEGAVVMVDVTESPAAKMQPLAPLPVTTGTLA